MIKTHTHKKKAKSADLPHDFLFQRSSSNKSIYINNFLLTNPVGSIHRLQKEKND